MKSILDVLSARHRKDIVLETNDRAVNAGVLSARIDSIADLVNKHLAPGPVASLLDNGIDWIALDLALHQLGRSHIPLPPFFSQGQRQHALQWAAGIVTPMAIDGLSKKMAEDGPYLTPMQAISSPLHENTSILTFSSGSTGQPKGVCLDPSLVQQVAQSLHNAMATLNLQRHLSLLPFGVLMQAIGGIYTPLLGNATIAVPSLTAIGHKGSGNVDLQVLITTLHKYRPEGIIVVPQLLLALISAVERGLAMPSSLKMIAVGGGKVSANLHQRAQKLNLPVFEGYGLSEGGSVVTLNKSGAIRPGSVGRVLEHTAMHRSADGELMIDGPRFLGYAGEQSCPAGPLATGDLGEIDDEGFIYIHGRRKAVYVTAWARNVSPEWIESELTCHPLIAQAVAWGEGRTGAVAIIVPRQSGSSQATIEKAVDEVNAGLPDYARVDSVILATEPFSNENQQLTGNGRVRRHVILDRYQSQIDGIAADVV